MATPRISPQSPKCLDSRVSHGSSKRRFQIRRRGMQETNCGQANMHKTSFSLSRLVEERVPL